MDNILQNLIRVGKVISNNPSKATVKVMFSDKDNMVSYDLPVIVRQTLKDKDYFIPDIGEQVVCIFLANGLESGFCIGSIYSNIDSPLQNDVNIRSINFEDGTVVLYNRRTHELNIECVGTVSIKAAKKIKLECPELDIISNVNIQGDVNATGSIIDTSGNTNHHSHL